MGPISTTAILRKASMGVRQTPSAALAPAWGQFRRRRLRDRGDYCFLFPLLTAPAGRCCSSHRYPEMSGSPESPHPTLTFAWMGSSCPVYSLTLSPEVLVVPQGSHRQVPALC